jgi:hypothetical protein
LPPVYQSWRTPSGCVRLEGGESRFAKTGGDMRISTRAPLALKDLIGPLVALAAVLLGIWQYRMTSGSEFAKPLREFQLRLYEQATSAAARLATLPRDGKDWTDSRYEFLRLYYGPLAMIENYNHKSSKAGMTVELAMILFNSCLNDEAMCKKQGADLQRLSLALAHTSRQSLGESWGYKIEQLRGDYQIKALDYCIKLDICKEDSKK